MISGGPPVTATGGRSLRQHVRVHPCQLPTSRAVVLRQQDNVRRLVRFLLGPLEGREFGWCANKVACREQWFRPEGVDADARDDRRPALGYGISQARPPTAS